MLQIVCGNAGAVLGQVEDYELTQLPALNAAVVVTTIEGSRRVWLVMDNGEKSLALEEITGTIARAAGRGAGSDIDGLDLNLGKGANGQITAAIMSSRNQAEKNVQGSVDLAQLVERARDVRKSEPSRNGN